MAYLSCFCRKLVLITFCVFMLCFPLFPFTNSIKCEDERFELDMVIEAGTSAINLLEPMEDEINAIDNTAGVRRR